MLFGIPVGKYALNNKRFKNPVRINFKGLLLVSLASTDMTWHIRTVIVHTNA